MDFSTPRVFSAEAMGIDRARIVESLGRTPRERFERGVRLSRSVAIFRNARLPRPAAGTARQTPTA